MAQLHRFVFLLRRPAGAIDSFRRVSTSAAAAGTTNPSSSSPKLSTAANTINPSSSSPKLSTAANKQLFRRQIDPDHAVALLSSNSSSRRALTRAVRCLASFGRLADADALLTSRLDPSANPSASSESYIAGIIEVYGWASLPDRAVDVLRSVSALTGTSPTIVSFNPVLFAFLRYERHTHRVASIFRDLIIEFPSIVPDVWSYLILIKANCFCGDTDKALQVFDEMRHSKGIAPNKTVYTTLIDSLYKESRVDDANNLWKEMVDVGCKPDMVAYNVKLTHFGIHGKPEEVHALIAEIEAAGLKPSVVAYNALITSYFKNDRAKDAKDLYNDLLMKMKGCYPNAATYKVMLQQLALGGEFDQGMKVFKTAARYNKVPDFGVLSAFVEVLMSAGRVENAKSVIDKVKEMFPENKIGAWRKFEKDLGLSSDDAFAPLPSEHRELALCNGELVASRGEEDELSYEEVEVSGGEELYREDADDSATIEELYRASTT